MRVEQSRIQSVRNALRGLLYILYSKVNFRIQCGLLVYMAIALSFIKMTLCEHVIILLSFMTVVIAEIFNTAIESICDLISLEYDLRIKRIKDISAGTVLLTFGTFSLATMSILIK